MISEVYDIECLSQTFTYVGYNRNEKKYYEFVIHESRNDYKKLINHLSRESLVMIGFRNDDYDYPIIHHMINHYNDYVDLSGEDLARKIYTKSQSVIDAEFSTVADKNKFIFQIDLFKIWHFDNYARSTSLKNLEVVLNLPNVEDMPFSHTSFIEEKDIPALLNYNRNDVFATNMLLDVTLGKSEHVLYKGKNKIQLRFEIQKKFKIPCINYNDIKLGTELILKLYCEKYNKNPYLVKKLKTERSKIYIKDCFPEWLNFKTNKFDSLVKSFSEIVVEDGQTKGKFEISNIYNNIKIDYGAGGAHACIKSGIYTADDEYGIYDLDIDSLYPILAVTQNLYPEHLGPEFVNIYRDEVVHKRLAEKKKKDGEKDYVIIEGLKLAANGTYGKTNEKKSWLYDPQYTMRTTISGQIFISMWLEHICENIPNCTILQVNTDGVTFKLPKIYKDKLISLSDEITTKCKLTYEMNEYKKMVIKDVNHYSAQYVNGKIKHKGDFEIDRELHKDPSMKIVRIALENYFFKNIPVSDTIKNHKNIFDFCLRLRLMRSANANYSFIKDGELNHEKLNKTTRYYVSNSGGVINQFFSTKGWVSVNKNYTVTLFNKYIDKDFKDYDVNYNFYISEAKKIIDKIEDKQLKLF